MRHLDFEISDHGVFSNLKEVQFCLYISYNFVIITLWCVLSMLFLDFFFKARFYMQYSTCISISFFPPEC
jgi:hypothetical protein